MKKYFKRLFRLKIILNIRIMATLFLFSFKYLFRSLNLNIFKLPKNNRRQNIKVKKSVLNKTNDFKGKNTS
jgi:hypothetical protein